MISATLDFEKKYWNQGYKLVCGVDEVGRGCFAGPIVVGSVIFPVDVCLPEGITDSKLLTSKKREYFEIIIKKLALAYSIAVIDVPMINEVGIGKAAQRAFKKSVEDINPRPDFILIDAFWIDGLDRRIQQPIVRGDQLSVSIAAASIIAKVYRDRLMTELDTKYPQYGFKKHKGYGTREHQVAIAQYGLSQIHRTSFNLSKFVTSEV